MRFRLLSDLHLEGSFKDYKIQPMESDSESVLVLAGDIGHLSKPETYLEFIKDCCNRFKYVFWVEGNHSYYDGVINELSVKDISEKYDLKNLYSRKLILEREKIAVIGQPLWTDFANENPLVMLRVWKKINDYKNIFIRKNGDLSRINPEDILDIHKEQKKKLFDDIDYYKEKGYEIVVVSHHHPSYKAIPDVFKHTDINDAFASNLDKAIKKRGIKCWFAGHVHMAADYKIGDTKVYCNPRGYDWEWTDWDEKFHVDI